jgi:hypothetical protein
MLHETQTTPVAVSAEQRARLGELGDQLIPAGGGMPSASEAGATGEHLDAVLAARPDLGPPLLSMLEAVEGLPAGAAIAKLKDTDADGWTVLTAVVPGAYFMNPEIREAIGYPGLEARPIDPDVEDWNEDGLLDSVVARGPVYRPTP